MIATRQVISNIISIPLQQRLLNSSPRCNICGIGTRKIGEGNIASMRVDYNPPAHRGYVKWLYMCSRCFVETYRE